MRDKLSTHSPNAGASVTLVKVMINLVMSTSETLAPAKVKTSGLSNRVLLKQTTLHILSLRGSYDRGGLINSRKSGVRLLRQFGLCPSLVRA